MRHIYKIGTKIRFGLQDATIVGFSSHSGSKSILPQFSKMVYMVHMDEYALPHHNEINHSFIEIVVDEL